MIYLYILTTIILVGLLYRAIIKIRKKQLNLESLQVNLDRTRNNLAEHEQQNDALHHQLNTCRIEIGNLKNKLEKLSQYQDVLDIEHYVAERKNQVESFVEATKTEAEFLLEKIKAEIESVRHYLEKLEKNSRLNLEAQAKERLGGFYNQAVEQENLAAISKALENKIHGYGIQYLYPAQTVLDQLIDGYDEIHAVQQLKEVRRKIKNAIVANTVGQCDYVEENRRLSAIALVTHVFNSKADLYLSQLTHDTIGEFVQALQDDFILINHSGTAFSHARINESFLKLRLEELRFAGLVLAFKAQQCAEQSELQEQMIEG
jgi:phage shock protein A